MIAEARRTGPKLARHDNAIELLHRMLVEENTSYSEAADRLEQATGVRVVPQTVAAWAKRWGVGRQGRHRTDGRVRETLRRLLLSGATIEEARKALRDTMGVRIGKRAVVRYRKEWGIRTHAPALAPKPAKCDLCGETTLGRLYAGSRWDIEGGVCGQCKDELTAEAKAAHRKRQRELAEAARRERIAAADAVVLAAAKRRTEADRRRDRLAESRRVEHMSRAVLVRNEALDLLIGETPGLPIVGRRFTADDLRGRAFTYWLKTTLRRDPVGVLLAG